MNGQERVEQNFLAFQTWATAKSLWRLVGNVTGYNVFD